MMLPVRSKANAVVCYLKELAKKGLLTFGGARARTIRLCGVRIVRVEEEAGKQTAAWAHEKAPGVAQSPGATSRGLLLRGMVSMPPCWLDRQRIPLIGRPLVISRTDGGRGRVCWRMESVQKVWPLYLL
jgi:hypothetical protein